MEDTPCHIACPLARFSKAEDGVSRPPKKTQCDEVNHEAFLSAMDSLTLEASSRRGDFGLYIIHF